MIVFALLRSPLNFVDNLAVPTSFALPNALKALLVPFSANTSLPTLIIAASGATSINCPNSFPLFIIEAGTPARIVGSSIIAFPVAGRSANPISRFAPTCIGIVAANSALCNALLGLLPPLLIPSNCLPLLRAKAWLNPLNPVCRGIALTVLIGLPLC